MKENNALDQESSELLREFAKTEEFRTEQEALRKLLENYNELQERTNNLDFIN